MFLFQAQSQVLYLTWVEAISCWLLVSIEDMDVSASRW